MIISEWEWLKLKLEMLALHEKAPACTLGFSFDDQTGKITCSFWYEVTVQLVQARASQEEQLSYYETWVTNAKYQINRVLQTIPVLSTEFDVDRDVEYEVLYDYGMGATLVCRFSANGVYWNLEPATLVASQTSSYRNES